MGTRESKFGCMALCTARKRRGDDKPNLSNFFGAFLGHMSSSNKVELCTVPVVAQICHRTFFALARKRPPLPLCWNSGFTLQMTPCLPSHWSMRSRTKRRQHDFSIPVPSPSRFLHFFVATESFHHQKTALLARFWTDSRLICLQTSSPLSLLFPEPEISSSASWTWYERRSNSPPPPSVLSLLWVRRVAAAFSLPASSPPTFLPRPLQKKKGKRPPFLRVPETSPPFHFPIANVVPVFTRSPRPVITRGGYASKGSNYDKDQARSDRHFWRCGSTQHAPPHAPSPPLPSVEFILEISFSFLSFLFLFSDPKLNRHLSFSLAWNFFFFSNLLNKGI